MTGCSDRLIVFSLAGSPYALPLGQTAEVLEGPTSFPVPGGPTFLAEAVNVHGRIVPLLDLAAFLGLGATEGGTILALDRRVADLALRVGGGVTIVPGERAAGEEDGECPLIERYLLAAGQRVAVLAPGRLVEQIEERLNEDTWRTNGQNSHDRG